jgi:hypothetical protein
LGLVLGAKAGADWVAGRIVADLDSGFDDT